MKKIFFLAVFFLLVAAVMVVFSNRKNLTQKKPVDSFEDCKEAGYPISESYPPACRTPDGKTYFQDTGNGIDKIEEIKVESPKPNSSISNPVKVTGEAKGSWYFEGSFPVTLEDSNGNGLGTTIAKAKGEWTTEDFVPFEALLDFNVTETTTATLILEKSNPSGLAENSDEVRIPVEISP